MKLVHHSIADISEGEAVTYLLAAPLWRSWLLTIVGIPEDVLDRQCVSLKDAPGHLEGDIDISLWSPTELENSIAIEVKVIKVGANAIESGKPNKLDAFKRGVTQANRLAQVGFAQVYLFALVLVDARKRNNGEKSYAGMSNELKSVIERGISTEGLDRRVGLMIWDFTQSMDYTPFTFGSSGGHLIRLAQRQEQPSEVTQWVSQKMCLSASDSVQVASQLSWIRESI